MEYEGQSGLSELARYEAYLREELPRSVRRELDTRLDKLLDEGEETLRSQLPEIVRDLQQQLYESYIQSRRAQSTPALSNNLTSQPANRDTPVNSPNAITALPTLDPNHSFFDQLAPFNPLATFYEDAFDIGFDGYIFQLSEIDPIPSDSGYSSIPALLAASTQSHSQIPLPAGSQNLQGATYSTDENQVPDISNSRPSSPSHP